MPKIVIQRPSRKGFSPTAIQLRQFGTHVLKALKPDALVTLRIVSINEMRTLNSTYRHKDKGTNVLSFKMDIPKGVDLVPLPIGDVVICAEIVNEEAKVQHIAPLSHWAHIIIHGILHLLGHDHETKKQTNLMQSIEIKLMKQMGFENPYYCEDDEIR